MSQFVTQAPSLSSDPALDRRMRLAQMLREQSTQGFGPTESFGGHAVVRSPLEGVGKVVQALMASKMDKENEPGLRKLGEKRDEQQALIEQLQRLQLGQVQREADIANLPGQFATPAGVAGADGTDAGAGMGGGTPTPAGFDAQGYAQALMAKDPRQGLAFQQALQKPTAPPLVSKPGDVARDPKTGAILWQNPEAADGEKDAFLRVMKAAGVDPASPQGKAMLGSYLQKMSTHQPAAQMNNYGSPLPIQLPGGGEGYIQPPTRPGGPSQVLTLPGTATPAQKPGAALTEGQAKANLFGTRAKESDAVIEGLAAKGVMAPSLPQQVTGGEGMTGALATAFASPQQQQVDQAQRDFINAVLRRESGAVIAIPEMANARKQYFPMPGDSKEVIAQKARNRKAAVNLMLAEVPDAKRGLQGAAPAAANNDPLGLR